MPIASSSSRLPPAHSSSGAPQPRHIDPPRVGSRSPHDGHFQFTIRKARPPRATAPTAGTHQASGRRSRTPARHEGHEREADHLPRAHLALPARPEGRAEGPAALLGPLLREVGIGHSSSRRSHSRLPSVPRVEVVRTHVELARPVRPAPRAAARPPRPRGARRGLPGLVLPLPLRRGGARPLLARADPLVGRADPGAPLGPRRFLHLLTVAGAPAGYFELEKHHDGSVEVSYFGLLPEFQGRGLGKYLLTEAAEAAWARGASRVWLHTCTLDHPGALANYLARGFRPFKTETYEADLPD